MYSHKDESKSTKPGFNLQQLTEMYLLKLSPLAYSEKYQRNVPIVDVYLDLMEMLNKKDDKDDKRKAYRAELLGTSPDCRRFGIILGYLLF